MSGRVQAIELPSGVVYARVSAAEGYGQDYQDVGVWDEAVAKVDQLGELITRVGDSVLAAARAAKPHEASVTFGIELTAKTGKALAVLAEGEAKAAIQVTLTWNLADQLPSPTGAANTTTGADA
ncbi:CU044_2847 family protein [Streptomyces sp. NPDC057838]|uniref:CU044_2847 family protein n=1 Tax=unclassified Streptomyces TaxID=2593676 RepID=UPI0036C44DAD